MSALLSLTGTNEDTEMLVLLDFDPDLACECKNHATGPQHEGSAAFIEICPSCGLSKAVCAKVVTYMLSTGLPIGCTLVGCGRIRPSSEWRFVPIGSPA